MARAPNPWLMDVLSLLAQGALFLVGLMLSLAVGMFLSGILDGPGGLLIATVIAGAGLLGAAALSQSLRDWILERGLHLDD